MVPSKLGVFATLGVATVTPIPQAEFCNSVRGLTKPGKFHTWSCILPFPNTDVGTNGALPDSFCIVGADDVVNETICGNFDDVPVELELSNLKVSEKIKKLMREEFDEILRLLDFDNRSYEIK